MKRIYISHVKAGEKEMGIEYVLLSHGNLSAGMKHTAEMIIGETPNLHSIGMDPDEGVEKVLTELNELMKQHSDSKFVLITDLFGGSVNNRVYEQFQSDPNVEIVTGMNLSLVIELVLQPEVSQEGIRSALSLSKENMIYMKDMSFQGDDDE